MRLPESEHRELHPEPSASRLNWLRAAVLGANDGIVSVAALVVGVAGATEALGAILISGIAGLTAGALSMAVGEYVSVSSQRDTEKALLAKEGEELKRFPEAELKELAELYEKRGISRETALQVAKEVTAHDALGAHAQMELGIDAQELTNPWHAAFASGASFISGAIIPLIAITLPPASLRIPVAFAAVLLALLITGITSARISGARTYVVAARVVIGGALAMAITFGIGWIFGTQAGL